MALTCKQCLNTNLLVILTLFGGGLGLALGFYLRNYVDKDSLLWIGILGEVYIRMLKMMIIPLIVSSIITATASLDVKTNGRISGVSLAYMMVTNLLPCFLGTFLCLILKPGQDIHLVSSSRYPAVSSKMETQDIFADLLRNIFPENIIVSTFEQTQTKYIIKETNSSFLNNTTNVTNVTSKLVDRQKSVGSAQGTNVLGLIVASCLFGMATSASKENGKAFYQFFTSATFVILQLLRWLIWFTPLGVASLLARTIASSADASSEFRHLGMFLATVVLGFTIWSLLVVPFVYFIAIRTNPYRFLYTLMEPLLIVFATSSTAIAIPQTLHALETNNQLDKRVTRFVIPLAASIGRSGTCLYINVSCLFVIQLIGLEITVSRLILVGVLSAVSSLANPAVTGASLVNIIIILTTLGIPPEAASLLYAFDWLLDRLRSITNLVSNALGVVITCHLCSSALINCEEQTNIETLLESEIQI